MDSNSDRPKAREKLPPATPPFQLLGASASPRTPFPPLARAPPRPNRGEISSRIPLLPILCCSSLDSGFRGAVLALLGSCLVGRWVSRFLLLLLLLRFVGFLGSSLVGAVALSSPDMVVCADVQLLRAVLDHLQPPGCAISCFLGGISLLRLHFIGISWASSP